MEKYKQDFIDFMVRSGVLTFGDFVTKSGRQTPFFINTGNYRTGSQIRRLGEFYATAIHNRLERNFDVLYGPAYKGIPLAVAAAGTLFAQFGHDIAYCFNRKEVKDHGEGGIFIGHRPAAGDRIVIIEDVVTAGTSVRESVALLKKTGARATALVVSVDRMERGQGEKSALAEVAAEFSLDAFAIVTLDEVTGYLHGRPIDGRIVLTDMLMEKIGEYRHRYGSKG
jgi:orotate phosphoribosyltransferase